MLYCLANGIRDKAKRRAIESTTGEAADPSIYEKFSSSFQRVATDVSQRTRTFTEKLAEYAEEEDANAENEGTYQAPENEGAEASASGEAVSRAPSAVPSVHSVHSEQPGSVAPSVKSMQSMHSEVADADTVASQVQVADAMLAEKGVTPKPAVEAGGKKYKRPRMAKVSKWIRGRFGRRKQES